MFHVRPKRTPESVALELARGLADGSIVLDAAEVAAPLDLTPRTLPTFSDGAPVTTDQFNRLVREVERLSALVSEMRATIQQTKGGSSVPAPPA